MILVYSLIGIVLILVPFVIYDNRVRRLNFERVFQGREPLDDEQFSARVYERTAVPFEISTRVRVILEEELDADLSRILPEDNPWELFEDFFDGDDYYDLYESTLRFEEEFEIQLSETELESTNNLGELIKLIWTKIQERT